MICLRSCGLRAALLLSCLAVFVSGPNALAKHKEGTGLKKSTVLIIRHAEKTDSGSGLSPAGEQRAQAYVDYFQHFQDGAEALQLDTLIAAADSSESVRPRVTLEPLSKALGIPVDVRFKDKQVKELVADLESRRPHVRGVLICWHHGEIAHLLAELGADYHTLLPKGEWPANVYDWVLVLHFDHDGRLESAKWQEEKLKIGG